MQLLIVEDEKLILAAIRDAVEQIFPKASPACFGNAEDALAYAEKTPVDVALLDIELPEMSGTELALRLKERHPKVNIIFVTGHAGYMGHALTMHASGYVLKPARPEDIARELSDLRHPVAKASKARIRVQCFGNFEVFVEGRRLAFPRTKAKELLAYLVFKNGSSVSKRDVAAALWEDRPYTRSLQFQIQKCVLQLEQILKDAGIGEMLERQWGRLSVNPEAFESDYAGLLRGDMRALNAYHGEFMAEYSWAEFTAGILLRLNKK